MPILNLDEMRGLAKRVLVAAKTSPENAACVAQALVAADADGLASHGLSRLPAFADQAVSGKVDGFAVPEVTRPKSAAVRVDARSGFGFPAIAAGLAEAQKAVKETGVVAVAVGRSHQSGAAGFHVERMAEKGLVALSFNNSPAGLGPWGGNRALFGTNPIAFACPRGSPGAPLVIDLSLSKVARGKIKLAADQGKPIPAGWAVDKDGNPTTDGKAAMAGTMLPMGDAKGAALALAVEILSAALTGSNFGFEASSFFTAEGPPPHVGQFFLVIDPATFGDGFAERVEGLLQAILVQPGTRLPGQRRLENRERARAQGVEIPDTLYQDLIRRAGGKA